MVPRPPLDLGRGHVMVATVATPDISKATDALSAMPAGIGLAEVRLDALWPEVPDPDTASEHLIALTDAATVPLLATLRPTRQGGRFEGDEQTRLGLLSAAAQAGFHALDVENDNQDMRRLLEAFQALDRPIVLSDHRFQKPPSRDEGMRHLLAMMDLHGAVHKLAYPAGAFPDILRALELTHGHAVRGGRPAVMPMGGGAMVRALLAVAGNRLTYGHAPDLPAAVPGQPATTDIQAVWDHWGITPQDLDRRGGKDAAAAGWFAVIGKDVRHSLSPAIHNATLRRAGRPERYGALDVPESTGSLRLLMTVADRIGCRGLSITNPHKESAHDILGRDRIDAGAEAVGAVNCVRFERDGPHGTNTDATALLRLLGTHSKEGDRLAVIGAGGAARAALWAGHERGLLCSFTSRDPVRAKQVQTDLGAQWIPWAEREHMSAEAWIQATPLGHAPDDPVPVPPEQTTGAGVVLEMVYGAGPTPFEQGAASHAATVLDGRTLLLEQGVDAYRFWFGEAPEKAAMQEALQEVHPAGPQPQRAVTGEGREGTA